MHFLNYGEARQYLAERGIRVATQTLKQHVSRGTFPVYRLAGRTYFTQSDLDIWIEKSFSPATVGPLSRMAVHG